MRQKEKKRKKERREEKKRKAQYSTEKKIRENRIKNKTEKTVNIPSELQS